MSGLLTLDLDINAEDLLKSHLLVENGVEHWNSLVNELYDRELIEHVWHKEEDEPRFVMGLVMEGADLNGFVIPNINLSNVYMVKCRLENCDLRGAQLAMCIGCSFCGSDLRGATFSHYSDLTDTNFTDSIFDESTTIELGLYDEGHPPKGLPGGLLARCRADPPEVREELKRTSIVPIGTTANLYVPGSLRLGEDSSPISFNPRPLGPPWDG